LPPSLTKSTPTKVTATTAPSPIVTPGQPRVLKSLNGVVVYIT
jgi:hypothetical protein